MMHHITHSIPTFGYVLSWIGICILIARMLVFNYDLSRSTHRTLSTVPRSGIRVVAVSGASI